MRLSVRPGCEESNRSPRIFHGPSKSAPDTHNISCGCFYRDIQTLSPANSDFQGGPVPFKKKKRKLFPGASCPNVLRVSLAFAANGPEGPIRIPVSGNIKPDFPFRGNGCCPPRAIAPFQKGNLSPSLRIGLTHVPNCCSHGNPSSTSVLQKLSF